MKEMFVVLVVMMDSCEYTYVKIDQIVHFKCIQFIMCQLHIKDIHRALVKFDTVED